MSEDTPTPPAPDPAVVPDDEPFPEPTELDSPFITDWTGKHIGLRRVRAQRLASAAKLKMQEEAEQYWSLALRRGKVPHTVPPIPADWPRYPLTPQTMRVEGLLLLPWLKSLPMPSPHPSALPDESQHYPYTQAVYTTTGEFMAVIVQQAPNETWPEGLHGVKAWDHLGGIWSGVVDTRGDGVHLVTLYRRGTAGSQRPVWFGPKHLCPEGMRPG